MDPAPSGQFESSAPELLAQTVIAEAAESLSTQVNGSAQQANGGVEDPDSSTEPKHPGRQGTTTSLSGPVDPEAQAPSEEPKLSKNRLRKLKRKADWEEQREDRKRKRKDKRHERQARKRDAKEAAMAEALAAGIDPKTLPIFKGPEPKKPSARVPVALVVDCDFEEFMNEGELISLSSQVTRCYSDNRQAAYQTHLYVSSYKGKMKERFESTLKNQQLQWKGVKLLQGDYVEAARDAREVMQGPAGGKLLPILQVPADETPAMSRDPADATPQPEPEPEPSEGLEDIVYLSSESPYTLDRLEANTCYVIGGLVDKNREKGLCYKRARQRGVRTAKLPIGEYLEMASRRVLTTNHVVEIMLKWLEFGDWGKAFMEVMPKRKGGKLKDALDADSSGVEGEQSKLFEDEDDVGDDEQDEQTIHAEGVENATLHEVQPIDEVKVDTAAGS